MAGSLAVQDRPSARECGCEGEAPERSVQMGASPGRLGGAGLRAPRADSPPGEESARGAAVGTDRILAVPMGTEEGTMNVAIDLIGLASVAFVIWLIRYDARDRRCRFCRSDGMIGGPCPECGKEQAWFGNRRVR